MKLLIIFILLVNLNLQAMEAEIPEVCTNCTTNIPLKDLNVEVKELLGKLKQPYSCDFNAENPKSDPNCLLIQWLKWKHHDYPAACKDFFINNDGQLGKYSQLVSNLMLQDIQENKENSIFLKDSDDIIAYCPGYKKFSTMQKVAFHNWIFELTAFPESSCNPNTKPNLHAPTTKAVCMYQLEDKPEFRYWRSAGFKTKRCAVSEKEIYTMEGCTGCAFDEYKRKVNKDGTPFGVFDMSTGKKLSGSYWASHNPLMKNQYECMAANNTKLKNGTPAWLKNCKNANWEWLARLKFFGRLTRFPLCETDAAEIEIKNLKAFKAAQVK